jgi:hypothetical protein
MKKKANSKKRCNCKGIILITGILLLAGILLFFGLKINKDRAAFRILNEYEDFLDFSFGNSRRVKRVGDEISISYLYRDNDRATLTFYHQYETTMERFQDLPFKFVEAFFARLTEDYGLDIELHPLKGEYVTLPHAERGQGIVKFSDIQCTLKLDLVPGRRWDNPETQMDALLSPNTGVRLTELSSMSLLEILNAGSFAYFKINTNSRQRCDGRLATLLQEIYGDLPEQYIHLY